jgi:predicted transcriptional regulator
MQTLHVADVMNPSVISISDESPLEEAIEKMRSNRISALVVTDHSGHMVGVISQTDLLRAWQEGRADMTTQPVNQYMTRDVISCAPYKSLDYAMQLLNQHRIHRLVVVETHDGGRFVTDRMMPVGILSQTDIVRALASQASPEEAAESVDANS